MFCSYVAVMYFDWMLPTVQSASMHYGASYDGELTQISAVKIYANIIVDWFDETFSRTSNSCF